MSETKQPMKTLRALVPIEHDGARVEPGDKLELPATAAAPLVECGAAEDITRPAKPARD